MLRVERGHRGLHPVSIFRFSQATQCARWPLREWHTPPRRRGTPEPFFDSASEYAKYNAEFEWEP